MTAPHLSHLSSLRLAGWAPFLSRVAVEDQLEKLFHLRRKPNCHAAVFVFDEGAAD